MIPPHDVRQIAQPSLLPVGFGLALAVLASLAALTSDRLWLEDVAEPPGVETVAR